MTGQKSTDGDIRLTSSNIKYLITLLRLGGDSGSVRGTDIAASLGITKPSAHTMLVSLAKMELVRKDHYGGATFTPNGLTLAEKYLSCYEALDAEIGKAQPCVGACDHLQNLAVLLIAVDYSRSGNAGTNYEGVAAFRVVHGVQAACVIFKR